MCYVWFIILYTSRLPYAVFRLRARFHNVQLCVCGCADGTGRRGHSVWGVTGAPQTLLKL